MKIMESMWHNSGNVGESYVCQLYTLVYSTASLIIRALLHCRCEQPFIPLLIIRALLE